MPLLKRDLLRSRTCAERNVTLEAVIGPAILLCDVEVNGVLGESLVLNRSGWLLRHLRMTADAVRCHQFCGRHLRVVAVLASLAIYMTDVAVCGTHAGLRFVILNPIGRVRHRRLVALAAGSVIVTRTAVALLRHELLTMQTQPTGLLVRSREYWFARGILAGTATLMALDTELCLVAHSAVRGIRCCAHLVITMDELVGVVGWYELESRRMTLVALLGGHETRALVLQTVAPIAPLHVGTRRTGRRVPELGMAHLALVRAREMHGVRKDKPAWEDVVEIRVAVHALRHVGRTGREDLDRGGLGPLADDRHVGVRQSAALHVLFDVARVAIGAGHVAHHAAVHSLELGCIGVRLACVVLDRLMVARDQIE